MQSTRLKSLCALILLMILSSPNVQAAGTNKTARVLYGGRSPALLAKKAVSPLGAWTKGHRAQNQVELSALSPSEIDYINQKEKADGHKRLRIGIGRALPQPVSISAESAPAGEWTVGTNGTRLWTVHLTSHGALGLRVHLEGVSLDPRMTVVTYNPFSPDATIAPVPCEKPDPEVGIWTPTVFGEDVVVECQVPAGVDVTTVRLNVTAVSHQYRTMKAAPAAAAGCENDITCYEAWMASASGVARIDFIDGKDEFLCSGCLLATHEPSRPENYFLTAHHCVHSASAASTVESLWFWYDAACGNPGNGGILVGGSGASLLATATASDFALLLMRDNPPNDAIPQDWRTNFLTQGEPVTGIHYPYPQSEKISFGNETDMDSRFWYLQWNYGVTEEGSSGSPLFDAQHRIVGQLWGGSSACDNLEGADQYGRFDETYASIRKWIDSFPFVWLQGSYSGLFSDAASPANQSSGFFSLMLRNAGAYSGKLRLAGKTYSFSGSFDQSGAGSNQLSANGAMLNLQMTLDPTPGAESISGTIDNGIWAATLLAKRAAFDAKTNVAQFAPAYTLLMSGGNSSDAPGGYGFASLTIDQSGRAKISGSLGDGTSFSQSTVVFPDNTLPLFGSLYGGKGVIDGWLTFSGGIPPDQISGSVSWLKDPAPKSKLYPLGFSLGPDVQGESYQRPADSMTPVVNISTGTVSFAGGDLASDFENDITIAPNNRVTNESANRLSMSFATSTGRFNGSVTPPLGARSMPYHGIVLQISGLGYGYFLGTNESGSVQLTPR